MIIIYILLGIIALFLAMHLMTEFSTAKKAYIAVVSVAVITAAWWFEAQNNKERAHIEALLLKYEHNKAIKCGNITVTKDKYNLSSRTFIGKVDSDHSGRIIPLSLCE
jgi:predicted membrane channel-forming protein YqfA (hemolysin III family)